MKLAERYIRQLEGLQDPIIAKVKEWNPNNLSSCNAIANGYRIITEKRQGAYKVTLTYTGDSTTANSRILEGLTLAPLALAGCFKSERMQDQHCNVSAGARKIGRSFTEAYYSLEFEKNTPFEIVVSKTLNYYNTMKDRVVGD